MGFTLNRQHFHPLPSATTITRCTINEQGHEGLTSVIRVKFSRLFSKPGAACSNIVQNINTQAVGLSQSAPTFQPVPFLSDSVTPSPLQICSPDLVVFLACTNQRLKERLEKRAEQQGRPDDNPKATERRLTNFKQNTIPLVKYFQERGLIVTVWGVGGREGERERGGDIFALSFPTCTETSPAERHTKLFCP